MSGRNLSSPVVLTHLSGKLWLEVVQGLSAQPISMQRDERERKEIYLGSQTCCESCQINIILV